MTAAPAGGRPVAAGCRRWTARVGVVALLVALNLGGGTSSAFWTAPSVSGSSVGASTPAAVVTAGAKPTVTGSGNALTVSWAANFLSNGSAVSGYIVKRYDAGSLASATVLTGCDVKIVALTCVESAVPVGKWVYTVTPTLATNWFGAESPKSELVVSDITAPINAIALSNVTGGAFYRPLGTIFYRGTAAGSFMLTNALTDSGSGPKSSATATLAGPTSGWTHSASVISSPASGPFVSGAFSWVAGTSSSPTEVVTGLDTAGNSAASPQLTFVNDHTAPTGATLTNLGEPSTSTTIRVNFTSATDGSGSGIKDQVLQRATATFSKGVCGALGAYSTVVNGLNPVSPVTDTVPKGACYRYQYVATDNVGNAVPVVGINTVKVPLNYVDAVSTTDNLFSYWRLGDVSSADSFSGKQGSTLALSDTEWLKEFGNSDAEFSADGRIFDSGADAILYSNSDIPVLTATGKATASYSVSTDLYLAEDRNKDDSLGVVGRFKDASNYYSATYIQNKKKSGFWLLSGVANGASITYLTKPASTLEVDRPYRMSLEMTGTTIRLLVDGAEIISTTDGHLTEPGKGGIYLDAGDRGQLDNYNVTPPLADSHGTNHGLYINGPTLGVEGALAGDSDTAASFDGTNYGSVSRKIEGAFSIEFWFKAGKQGDTQESGNGTQWWQGAGLVDAEVDGAANDFGVSLFSNGRVVAGSGNATYTPDVSILSATGFDDGKWHHVVFTRAARDEANPTALVQMALYVDGTLQGTAKGRPNPLATATNITFGRIQTGTYYYTGALDEVAVYDAVLTPETVKTHSGTP